MEILGGCAVFPLGLLNSGEKAGIMEIRGQRDYLTAQLIELGSPVGGEDDFLTLPLPVGMFHATIDYGGAGD
jgi:hypothetical protein